MLAVSGNMAEAASVFEERSQQSCATELCKVLGSTWSLARNVKPW